MKITYPTLGGAWSSAGFLERGISEEEVRAILESPDLEYPGRRGRTVAERTLPGSRLAVRVVYNRGLEDERIVVTAERGRPTRQEGGVT